MKRNFKMRCLCALLACSMLFTACGSSVGSSESESESQITEDTEVTVEKEDTNIVTTPSEEESEETEEEEVVEPTPEELLDSQYNASAYYYMHSMYPGDDYWNYK